jgi:diadenosine tetraphosphatase ApaH/serine/threonine PP2A family protein phosphatase
MRANVSFCVVVLSVFLALSGYACSSSSAVERQVDQQPPRVAAWKPARTPSDEANLVIMGDWGADTKRQREVAATLASYVGGHRPAFNAVLTAGDNLPARLKSVDDMNWQKLFEDMYDASRINIPFYATLGNHDYDEGKQQYEFEYVAKHPDSRFKLLANWYRLEFPQGRPLVTVLMLNSNRAKLSKEDWARQLQWMDEELAKPRKSQWVMACAHHPLFDNGNHRDGISLQKDWGELFKKYKVDFYFCGHDHTLQHLQLKDWPTNFVIAGGGGQKRMPLYRDDRGPFGRSLYGFAHVRVTASSVTVKLIDGLTGKTVHELAEDRQRETTIVMTTPNDKPIPLSQQVGKPNTPAHRVIKATGDDYKRMNSILSFSAAERSAFDKAVHATGLSEEEQRRQVLAALSLKQLQRWAGYVLYMYIIDEFEPAGLSDEQKQQAFAVCVTLASQTVDAKTAENDPTLEPEDKLQEQAIDVIHDHVLTTEQRKHLAEEKVSAAEAQDPQTQPAGK